jgi:hypothetical protein
MLTLKVYWSIYHGQNHAALRVNPVDQTLLSDTTNKVAKTRLSAAAAAVTKINHQHTETLGKVEGWQAITNRTIHVPTFTARAGAQVALMCRAQRSASQSMYYSEPIMAEDASAAS